MVGCPPGRIGGNVVLQRHRDIDQPSRHMRVPQNLLPRRRITCPPSSRNCNSYGHVLGGCLSLKSGSTGASNVLDLDSKLHRSIVALDREFDVLADTHGSPIGRSNPTDVWSVVRLRSRSRRRARHSTVRSRAIRPRPPANGAKRAHDHTFDSEPCCDRFVCGDDPNARRRHPAVSDQLRHDPVDRVDRNGKADSGV